MKLLGGIRGPDADLAGVRDDHPLLVGGHEAEGRVGRNGARIRSDVEETGTASERGTCVAEVETRPDVDVRSHSGEDILGFRRRLHRCAWSHNLPTC